jgi:hypothetical protein
MHLALGSDIFDSFGRYQTRLIREYNRLAREFGFVSIDARRSVDDIQGELRRRISHYLERGRTFESVRLAPVEPKALAIGAGPSPPHGGE